MAITFTTGPIKLANVTAARNEINRIRVKFGLAAVSFGATDTMPRAATMQEIKTQIKGIEAAPKVPDGILNVTVLPDFVAGSTIIKNEHFTNISALLNQADNSCADYVVNSDYANNAAYYSTDKGYDRNDNADNANNSDKSVYTSDKSYCLDLSNCADCPRCTDHSLA